jgi:hypothetical protein
LYKTVPDPEIRRWSGKSLAEFQQASNFAFLPISSMLILINAKSPAHSM